MPCVILIKPKQIGVSVSIPARGRNTELNKFKTNQEKESLHPNSSVVRKFG